MMKFREWEDFANQINEYGRIGYIKKRSDYNTFTHVNSMIMEHKVRHDEVEFILYPDDESFDRDYSNEAYTKPPFRSDNRVSEADKNKLFTPRPDQRTKGNRSQKYPPKPGTPKPGPPKRKEEQ
jgi:hypothetical protein